MSKMPEFCVTFARKIPFSGILRAIQGSKADSERIRPNTHRFTGAIMLNEPLMRPRTLLYSISLDA